MSTFHQIPPHQSPTMAVTLPFKVTLILYFKVLGSYETGGGAPYAYDGLGAGSSFFCRNWVGIQNRVRDGKKCATMYMFEL